MWCDDAVGGGPHHLRISIPCVVWSVVVSGFRCLIVVSGVSANGGKSFFTEERESSEAFSEDEWGLVIPVISTEEWVKHRRRYPYVIFRVLEKGSSYELL